MADTRLWTVSHGSDRRVCPEKTDVCAAKNRHVHFRVKRERGATRERIVAGDAYAVGGIGLPPLRLIRIDVDPHYVTP